MAKWFTAIELKNFYFRAEHDNCGVMIKIPVKPFEENLGRFNPDLFHSLGGGVVGITQEWGVAQIVEGSEDQVLSLLGVKVLESKG